MRVARSVGQYATVLIAALLINFALLRVMPGGPLVALGGADVGQLTPEARAQLLSRVGLDRPIYEQFFDYVTDVFRGDLGTSYLSKRPVTDELLGALPWTLLLVGSALVLTTVIGVAVGASGGLGRQRRGDSRRLSFFLVLESLPTFWVAMMLIAIFGVGLGWFPTFGASELADRGWRSVLRHLALPVLTLVIAGVGHTYLVMRSSMLAVSGQQFIEFAQVKGISQRRVLLRHAIPNALLPVYTLIFLELGVLLGGALVVETVFTYPGLGRLTYDAVIGRDFPLIQGSFLILTVTVIAMNLAADLTYPLLDPRLRRARRA